jgi:cysteine desulfuration protein SufE
MIPLSMKSLVDTYLECDNDMEKFQFFIDLADDIPLLESKDKNEDSKVIGCASDAWIVMKRKDKILNFYGDADGVISKGFLAFFILGFNGCCAKEVLSFTVNDMQSLGMIESLSPSRANGAVSSLNKIHSLVNDSIY